MAFPTTSVLTTFAGADEDPLSEGGNWAKESPSGRALRLLSNAATSDASGTFGASYWTPNTFDASTVPGVELFCDVSTIVDNLRHPIQFYIDLPTDTPNGYEIDTNRTTDLWRVKRITAGVGAAVGADVTQTVSAGDGIGVVIRKSGSDTIIDCYYRSGAGSWGLLFSRTDTGFTTFATTGNIGASSQAQNDLIDNFGGGNAAAAASVDELSAGRRLPVYGMP